MSYVSNRLINSSNIDDELPKVLILSSSLLVDRVLVHTNLIKTLGEFAEVHIWAASFKNDSADSIWNSVDAPVEELPPVKPFRQFPYIYLRRLSEFVWDYRQPVPSRVSMRRHHRDKKLALSVRSLQYPARLLAFLRSEKACENYLEKLMLDYPRSPEAEEKLKKLNPTAVVVTGPFQFEQPAIYAAAKKLGIPVLAYIPSWDNVTTKNRMVFKYDGYLVWSDQIKKELQTYYPDAANKPIFVVGAPQYDIFRCADFFQSREDFCRSYEFDPNVPLIVYALGSPNFLKEHHGAVETAERISRGELGNVQMLVRPHPIHDNAELHQTFERFAPQVKLQHMPNAGKKVSERTQDKSEITEWLNTFRHADVVINLSSTVTIDAALFNRPVINLDFDPQPGQFDQKLIRDINHQWNHFQPVAESGGVQLVNNYDELIEAVKTYLENPQMHSEARRRVTQYVCQYTDGKCGERMAIAIAKFAHTATSEKITPVNTKEQARSEHYLAAEPAKNCSL